MSNTEAIATGVLPVLPSSDVAESLDFYTNILGFTEILRQPDEDGKLLNAQVSFAGGQLMFNLNPTQASNQGGGVYFWFRLSSEQDIDAMYERLKSAGVSIVDDIADQFWGDRSFSMLDNAGFHLAFNQAISKVKQKPA